MEYFTKPTSEEDLKEQYRKLLIQYDYRSSKNQAIIEAISKEYKQLSLQLKGESIKKTAQAVSNEYHSIKTEYTKQKEAERERISQLKRKTYSNQEIQSMIGELHRYIDRMLKQVVSDNKSPYRALANIASKLDEIHLCRWFHNHLDIMASQAEMQRYDIIREKLEYGLKGRANQDNKSEEAFISAYEKSLGQYIHKKLMEYEDFYLDPLEIVEREQGAKKESRFDNLFIKLQIGMLGITIAIIGISIGAISGRGNLLYILSGGLIGAILGGVIYKKSVSALIGLNKKSLYTSRKRSRVTEEKEYVKEKNLISILRFFLR